MNFYCEKCIQWGESIVLLKKELDAEHTFNIMEIMLNCIFFQLFSKKDD